MGQGISEMLPFAIGVAIVPIPVIAVILILFSARARVNGPMFLLGWIVGLSLAAGIVYALAAAGDAGSDPGASDTVSWGRILLGVLLLLLAGRTWRKRPAPGSAPGLPKWMAGLDTLGSGKALGLGVLLSAGNPKNLILVAGAAAGLAQLGLSTPDAVGSLVVFVAIASLSIATPVVYYLVGGEKAKAQLDELKGWLGEHNAAVMTVLFLVFGAVLIANGLAPLTD